MSSPYEGATVWKMHRQHDKGPGWGPPGMCLYKMHRQHDKVPGMRGLRGDVSTK